MKKRPASPCYRCKSRIGGCKLICKSFKEWDKKDKAIKAENDKEAIANLDYLSFKLDNVEHSRKLERALKGRH